MSTMPAVSTQQIDPAITTKWPDITVSGVVYSLAHLHPMTFTVASVQPNLPQPMKIYVRFLDHCFGEHENKCTENPISIFPWCSVNSNDRRAFSSSRYSFTQKLVNYVSTMGPAKVFQSNAARNFVFVTGDCDLNGNAYAFYFNLQKSGLGVTHHIEMNVVSCYAASDHVTKLGKNPKRSSFAMLCGRIYSGRR